MLKPPLTSSLSVPPCVQSDLDLLQQPLNDAQEDVPRDHLQLFTILLDQPGYGQDNFIRNHLVGRRHGLRDGSQTSVTAGGFHLANTTEGCSLIP